MTAKITVCLLVALRRHHRRLRHVESTTRHSFSLTYETLDVTAAQERSPGHSCLRLMFDVT